MWVSHVSASRDRMFSWGGRFCLFCLLLDVASDLGRVAIADTKLPYCLKRCCQVRLRPIRIHHGVHLTCACIVANEPSCYTLTHNRLFVHLAVALDYFLGVPPALPRRGLPVFQGMEQFAPHTGVCGAGCVGLHPEQFHACCQTQQCGTSYIKAERVRRNVDRNWLVCALRLMAQQHAIHCKVSHVPTRRNTEHLSTNACNSSLIA